MLDSKQETHTSRELPKSVFIAGGGIAGCCAALELAEMHTPERLPKYNIILCDQQPEILRGSSDITPGRMGLGFHYVHKPTAIMYLQATIEFQRKFGKEKDFRVGATLPEDSPLRSALQRGRYFITKDSRPTKKEILKTYRALKKEYARLVTADSANKVFGEPKDFFRILKPKEYEDYVNMDRVAVAIETPECLLDWPAFRKFLIGKLEGFKNIQIHTNTKVEKISGRVKELNYLVETVSTSGVGRANKYIVDTVVNCTWENARELSATAGLKQNTVRTNRLKALITVKLPDPLKDKPSGFFCMGPHAMFSNLGDGFAAMTYAPKTSMINSTDLAVPEEIKKYLQGRSSLEEKMNIATKIKEGVTEYIPGMKAAEIQDVRFGIVQTNGEVDIFDHRSEFSRRDYNGISVESLNFITNACMKLLYGPENGVMVASMIEDHMKELAAAKKFIASVDALPMQDKERSVQAPDLDLLRYAGYKAALKGQIIGFFNSRKLNRVADSKKTSSMDVTGRVSIPIRR